MSQITYVHNAQVFCPKRKDFLTRICRCEAEKCAPMEHKTVFVIDFLRIHRIIRVCSIREKECAQMQSRELPLQIRAGKYSGGHIQGIAVDTVGGYIYLSFTTVLVKADLTGQVVGTVEGLIGHLGCIAFNNEDGRVYGSLELKHDAIGQGIMDRIGVDIAREDAFYIAMFRGDRICRVGMDAEKDGIMTAVYLEEVARDYADRDVSGHLHRYGCSGVDGTGFGPVPGDPPGSPSRLLIAYGIYDETRRRDNDHQVLLVFDWRGFSAAEKPLCQGSPHHSGIPAEKKLFVYTGNTTYGVQNLEYDPFTGDWLMSVYPGKKAEFPNFPLFVIDGARMPCMGELTGRDGERGLLLRLKQEGCRDGETGIWGLRFPKGQTGMYAFGDGRFYISFEEKTPEKLHTAVIRLCRRLPGDGEGFEIL